MATREDTRRNDGPDSPNEFSKWLRKQAHYGLDAQRDHFVVSNIDWLFQNYKLPNQPFMIVEQKNYVRPDEFVINYKTGESGYLLDFRTGLFMPPARYRSQRLQYSRIHSAILYKGDKDNKNYIDPGYRGFYYFLFTKTSPANGRTFVINGHNDAMCFQELCGEEEVNEFLRNFNSGKRELWPDLKCGCWFSDDFEFVSEEEWEK